MKSFTKVLSGENDQENGFPELVLTFQQREKSRLKAQLSTGQDIGLFLERGTVLKAGDILVSEDGDKIRVVAARETVSTVTADSAHRLLRIAYHLGNRHVPLQVEPNWLRYRHDHVLDDMVRLIGGSVTVEEAPIQPESGAYGGGHHHGETDHGHHSHGHHSHAHANASEEAHGHIHAHHSG